MGVVASEFDVLAYIHGTTLWHCSSANFRDLRDDPAYRREAGRFLCRGDLVLVASRGTPADSTDLFHVGEDEEGGIRLRPLAGSAG